MGVLAICIAALLGSAMAIDVDNVELIAYSLGNCPEHPDAPNRLNETSFLMDPDTKELTMSGILIITDPVLEEEVSLRLTLEKCLVGDDDNSCSRYFEINYAMFCEHLDQSAFLLTPILAATKNISAECPIQPGEYKIEHAAIRLPKVLADVPFNTGFLELNLVFTNYGVDVSYVQMCVTLKGKIQKRMRKRKKTKKPESPAEASRRALADSRGSLKKKAVAESGTNSL